MYARQHPVYRPLSTDFAKLYRQGASQNHRDGNADELTAHDFTFMERIGRGGFGKVYRAVLARNARHLPLARSSGGEVAIKKIDKAALKSRAAEQRLAAEVAIHETLDHTHIVRLYDSFEDSQYVYIVMELCSHGDIWRYLRNRGKLDKSLTTELAPLSEAEARHVMQQVCRGIAYLHGRQILHRDLKLANILLTETLDVRIGDFGLATWLRNDRTETTTMCGTPSYISPEILARQPYGVESDVWALGCLFVTLLTGAQPFRNVSRITEDAVRQIRLPYDLSHEARNLVRAMLRIDPRQRITTQRLLEHPFFASHLPEHRLVPVEELARQQRRPQQEPFQQRRFRSAHTSHSHGGPNVLPPRQPGNILNRRRHDDGDLALAAPPPDGRPAVSREHDSAVSHAYRRSRDHSQQQQPSDHHHRRPRSVDVSYSRVHNSGDIGTASAKHVDLQAFSIRRLPAMKRAMKNGKVYIREDRLLVLDLSTLPSVIAMDDRAKQISEFRRPAQLQLLSPETAHRVYAWDMQALPERVARGVRIACRCVSFLLSQQKRIQITTPQGEGTLFENEPQADFAFAFFNGIKVTVSRQTGLATVEIPSQQDLPNEILKIPLAASPPDHRRSSDDLSLDLSALDINRHTQVPAKARGILSHAMEALRKVLGFDSLVRVFEDDSSVRAQYRGEIQYPVKLGWDQDAGDLDFVPPGLVRRSSARPTVDRTATTTTQTAGSSTAVNGGSGAVRQILSRHHSRNRIPPVRQRTPPAYSGLSPEPRKPPHWDTNMVDRRVIDDTPTRRVNMGPLTQLVTDYTSPTRTPNLQDPYRFLTTPGCLRTPANRFRRNIDGISQQLFEDAGFIDDLGWCLVANNGRSGGDDDLVFTMLFCDGCRLLVRQREQTISYRSGDIVYEGLPIDESIPPRVRERIKWLPKFLIALGFEI